MRHNAIELARRGAEALRRQGDGAAAYALHEMANNLIEVMEGRSTLEEWARCYTIGRSTPADLDALFPDPAPDAAGDRDAA